MKKRLSALLRGAPKFLLLHVGLLFTAFGVALFEEPNRFAIGGVSGLGILVQKYIPAMNVGVFMAVINGLLIVAALLTIGKSFGLKTIYAAFMLSAMVSALTALLPLSRPLTDDRLLELAFAILLPSVGSAIVFNLGGSTGGTDIIAMILKKYLRLEIGKSLLVADFLITCGAFLVFGVQTGLYCMLGLILKSTLVDLVIDGINVRKYVVIISDRHEDIRRYITETLQRGATLHRAYGAYSNEPKLVIATAVSRRQAVQLRDYIRKTDPAAFLTITNSSEIIGNGFRSI